MSLLQGPPGSGKTTLALQFLLAGAEQGEKGAYITFSETAPELRQSAKSHGWSLKSLSIIDLTKMNSELGLETQYTVLHPADVELAETSTDLLRKIKVLSPQRLVLDSLTEFRMVAPDLLRYRRQILALKQALSELGCTVLFLDDQTGETGADLLLQSIAHSVIQLTSEETSQGGVHRRIKVTKMRGVPYIEGYHDMRIATGGIRVFPRLIARSGSPDLGLPPIPRRSLHCANNCHCLRQPTESRHLPRQSLVPGLLLLFPEEPTSADGFVDDPSLPL